MAVLPILEQHNVLKLLTQRCSSLHRTFISDKISCEPSSGEYNSGGTIKVDGWEITVPKNLLVQFPTIWTKFRDLCDAGAKGYEVSVFGNIVNDKPIAAQIAISAGFSLREGVGYIESIDVADGSFQLKGSKTKLRLNDPNGKFGKASNLAPFFPVDDENPSITAFSGFPMCFPRSADDPKCPSSNRPAGSTRFAPRDPLAMIPFLVGDYITYAALYKNEELLVYEASATNVDGTTTASDTVPNYILVEDALIGVTDSSANVEVADSRVSVPKSPKYSAIADFLLVHRLPFQLCWRLGADLRDRSRSVHW